MIFKWIHCKVYNENRDAFSKAQAQWGLISSAPGFIGQFGGWDLNDASSACIISLWRDKQSFNNFMEIIHDRITFSNKQESTYYECKITFFDPIIPMPGKYEELLGGLAEARLLRVADCIVKPKQISHFEKVQKEVWLPEMQNARGMLGGQFCKKYEDNRYLVTTLWDTKENHSAYLEKKVPRLREIADVHNDIESIVGRLIELELSWLVIPVI